MSDSAQNEMVEAMRGKLIVSCQAYPGEPMRDPNTMAQVAQAAVEGGAVAVRLQGLADIAAARRVVEVPIIGLWKDGTEGVYITPTLKHALDVAKAGADIVAIDATRRPRPDGSTFAEIVAGLKREFPDVLVMADCGCLDDAVVAEAVGADLLGTTLAGYTEDRPKTDGPDLELITQIAKAATAPVIAEGRINTPEDATDALKAGAFSVCVGSAITHPTRITQRFIAGLPQ